MTDLSIIIISYNTKDITKKCVETCLASLQMDSNLRADIVVLDNNSTDGTVAELEKINDSQLKIIRSAENFGFSRGNNEAVKHAEGKYILFLNSDIEVINDAIPKLYNFFTSTDNKYNFLGGKLFEKDGKTAQASCGPFYTLPIVCAALFLKGDYYGLTRYSPKTVQKVDWISGACIMTQKDVFETLGGFDEKIFMYMEEIDLLYRANKRGLTAGFYPHAHFIHLGSASSNTRSKPIIQVFRGFLYFYKKHRSHTEYVLLRSMLQLKALISLTIGHITSNSYLVMTYEEALDVAQDR